MTEQQAWMALNAAELSPRRAGALLEHFGDVRALWGASVSEWAAAGLQPAEVVRLQRAKTRDFSAACETMARTGIGLLALTDPEYPSLLKNIHDPPPVLFIHGELSDADQPRNGHRWHTPGHTLSGCWPPRHWGADWPRRIHGSERIGRRRRCGGAPGGLCAGGRTIGVLACGVDVPYPRDTLELREQMVGQGAVISEVPLGTPASRPRFPARNRIISGLCIGVVVTEAPERSGALITASSRPSRAGRCSRCRAASTASSAAVRMGCCGMAPGW